jgi:solute carrier family 12 sodium/potassium/chloride transporter 2
MAKSRKAVKGDDALPAGYQFGTFQGVFTPSILTILGVIMFLRFGWVLGNVGILLTMVIVTLSTAITLLTGLSLSATATNMKIGGGGAYYLISRSLGLEVGTAIGLPLFLAQALGIAFYITGFSEAVSAVVDLTPWLEQIPFPITEVRLIAVITLVSLTLLAMISADIALKTQLLILAAIITSLVSFFVGGPLEAPLLEPGTDIPSKLGFWAVFAVFFPAVTGIEAGISMSGDLKNPAKSLPRGTLAAVLTGYAVYMAIPLYLSWVIHDEGVLLVRPLIMMDVARWGNLILVGVFAATLSSALGAILGAPRTLQAIAKDKVLPRFLAKGYGKTNDPIPATGLSFIVALVAILLGDLNLIAPILSMFFLTSYGLINLSAGLEGLIESPTWRPKFKFPWWGSLLGALACLLTMLMIDLGATLTALIVTGGLYTVMKRRQLKAHWGDMRYGILMLMVRHAIRRLIRRPADERNWRPNILVFSGSPQSRWHLIELSHALARGPSYLTLATIMPTESWSAKRVQSLKTSINDYLRKRDVEAMIKIFPSSDVLKGAEALIQAYGFGPLEPNTIVIGESQDEEKVEGFTRLIRLTHRLERNLVIVREGDGLAELSDEPRIDLWWRGGQTNVGLMITLAYQLRRSGGWQNSRIVLKRMILQESERMEIEDFLTGFLDDQRLEMEYEILNAEGRVPFDLMRESSADASIVLIGLRHPQAEEPEESYVNYYRRIVASTHGMPVVMVMSAEKIDFSEIIGVG